MKRVVSIALSVLLLGGVVSFTGCEEDGAQTQNPTPSHVHEYVSEVVNPTCTEKGYTKHTCSCGDTKTDTEVPAKGHSYTDEVVSPTCLADGYTKHTCSCGDTYNDTTTPKNPNNHHYESVVVPATCQAQGYTEYTCECGETYQDSFTPMSTHAFEDGVCACGLSEAMLAALTFNEFDDYCEVADCDTAYVGEMIIPATHNGKPVTYIRGEAFNQCGGISSVKIPEGVTAIGPSAFNLCSSLASIEFPSTLVDIGDYAFSGTALTTVEIPSTVKIFRTNVFGSNNHLDTTQMATYGNCYYLGNSENPYMVLYKMIEDNCTEYPIHEDATIIYDYAFSGARHDSFVQNNHINLHDGITSIGDRAFYVGAHFFVDRVPSSLMHVGKEAFHNSSNGSSMGKQLSGGYFMGNDENPYVVLITPTSIQNGVYTVKPETKIVYDYAFKSLSYSLTSVVFHDEVLEIGQYAFYDCYKLEEIILPAHLKELTDYMFYIYSTSSFYLQTLVVPASVKEIGDRVFKKWFDIGGFKIYFEGSKAEWKALYLHGTNERYSSASVYYYSEQEPPLNQAQTGYDGAYWHYVDGVRTNWVYTAPSA